MNSSASTLVDAKQPLIRRLPFTTDSGAGERARIGLLVLETDQTMETEFRDLAAVEGVSIYHARLRSDPNVTADTLSRMEAELPVAARLLPVGLGLRSIGYGCTSGATMIGEAKVCGIINEAHPNVPSTNPLTAASVAMRAMGARRIALVTPYSPDVTETMRARLVDLGFSIPVVGSFYEADDFVVGKIDERSILEAALLVGASTECEGVFISCTSLRAAAIIEKAERALNKPVTASNHALAWHLLRLAGIDDVIENKGRLFRTPLTSEGAR